MSTKTYEALLERIYTIRPTKFLYDVITKHKCLFQITTLVIILIFFIVFLALLRRKGGAFIAQVTSDVTHIE